MKNLQLLLLIIICGLKGHSQITFEKGYFIGNNGIKTNCLIKNIDWKNNPSTFLYKTSENDEVKTATIKSTIEFAIDNGSKYIRKSVSIDRSSDDVRRLSTERQPIFKEESLYLKVLVEGKANLYLYEDKNFVRFFFNKEGTPIEQLVYKRYLKPGDKIGTNGRFKNQIWNNLKCPDLKIRTVENLKYQQNVLVKFFIDYNKCIDGEFYNYVDKKKRDLFNLNLRPGINSSTYRVWDTDLENKLGFRLGAELELIMPFNKEKWAFIIEPTFQSYKSEGQVDVWSADVNYKSIEIPMGFRHYFFLNQTSKIFINGFMVFDYPFSSSVDFSPYNVIPPIKSRNNWAFGLGYKLNNRVAIEFRYQTRRRMFDSLLGGAGRYRTTSLIFGYTLF